MANFFLLSFDDYTTVHHAKISVKFDNFNYGKARISFRLIFTSSKKIEDSIFYLLIKNDENAVVLADRNAEYNGYLDAEQFRQVAGAYGLESVTNLEYCTVFTMGDFPENPKIEGKKVIHPKKITCGRFDYRDIPKQLKNLINRRDILLGINVEDIDAILKEAPDIFDKESIWILQFRIFLDNFVGPETLRHWKTSSESWSVDFDIHKRQGYENLVECLDQMRIMKYPESAELWFTIPHSHHFVASSPIYEKAIRLKSEDIEYKTEKQQIGEFETLEGDYAVKIVNTSGDFVEFSIICISPFLPGEKPEELKEKIREFRAKESRFVTWDNIFAPFTLLVAILSLLIGSTVVLITEVGGCCERIDTPFGPLNLKLLVLSSVFTGLVIWGISASLSLGQSFFAKKRSYRRKEGVCIGLWALVVAIIIVISILCVTIILLLYFSQNNTLLLLLFCS